MSTVTALSNAVEGLVCGARRRIDEDAVELAIDEALQAARRLPGLSSHDRAAILERVGSALAADAEDIAEALTAESGYLTRRDMVLEVQRSVEVFTHSAAVARVGLTRALNADAVARARNTTGFIRREPIGPVLGITAFNGPLLIAAHKIAPAIIAGVPILIKPSPRVPASCVKLAEYVLQAGWPEGAIGVLPVENDVTMQLVRDPRLPVISFTGGEFGWSIKDAAPRKHVHLELGGVGAVIVADDADLEVAAEECAAGGFVRSGQACISVQRVYVQSGAYERFVQLLTERVARMVTGEASDPATEVGPLVSVAAAERVEAMIAEATAQGARACCGGTREGAIVTPTVLADVTSEMQIARREAFGPVVAVAPVQTLAAAVAETNAVDGAILAGIYTQDIDVALSLAEAIRAGGVIINGPTSWRVDHMPYGGVGTSGFGREGIEAMVDEYTEPKVIAMRHRPTTLGAGAV